MLSKSSSSNWLYFGFHPNLDEFVRVEQGILASDGKQYLENYHSHSKEILYTSLVDTNKDRCLVSCCL